MNKRDFFITAMKVGRLGDKKWLLSAFSVVVPTAAEFDGMKPFDIIYVASSDKGIVAGDVAFIDEQGNRIALSDYQFDPRKPAPPYEFKETLKVSREDIVNVPEKETVETTYGRLVANWLLSVYPFGDKIPFINRRFSVKDIEKVIEEKLTSTPTDDSPRDPNKIYIDEYNRYRRAAGLINGITQLCVPSASPKSLTRHPDAEKVRTRLLEENKDRLHDPAVIAKIDAELNKLDREWLDGDISMGFFIKPKSIDVVRKKAHYMMGSETAFADSSEGTLIPTSLSDGWDITKLPAMANNLREGSFDRGAQTALGGADTKFILRVMQNTIVEEEDCGTTIGYKTTVSEDNKNQYIGNYMIQGTKIVEITKDNVDNIVGKEINLRSPLFCKTGRAGFCAVCIGKRYGAHPTGLATAAASIGSTFMGVFMKSMHGRALNVTKWSPSTTMS